MPTKAMTPDRLSLVTAYLQNFKGIAASTLRGEDFRYQGGVYHYPEVVAAAVEQAFTATEMGLVVPARVKAECSGRINAVLKDLKTTTNMVAESVALARKEAVGSIGAEEQTRLDLLQSGHDWVLAMQTKCRELITAKDTTYADDSHWPAPPAGLKDLADLY